MPRKKIKEPKLENGLCREGVRLACVSGTGEAPGICIRVYCGSAADPVGKSGLAHLVEYLMMMAPSLWDEWFEYQYHDGLVEELDASTTHAYVDVKLVFKPAASASDIDNMLIHLLKAVFNADLENAPFKRQRRLALNKVKKWAAEDALDACAVQYTYADPAWSRPTSGLFTETSTLTLEDCVSFYRESFRVSPVDIVLYGDLPFTKAKKRICYFFNKKYPAKNVIQYPVVKCHVYQQGHLHLAIFGHLHPLYELSLLWCGALSEVLNKKLDKDEYFSTAADAISSFIDMGECGVQTWHFEGLNARQHEILVGYIKEAMNHLDTAITPELFETIKAEDLQDSNDIMIQRSVSEKLSGWPYLFILHFNKLGLDIREAALEKMRAITYEDFIQYHQKQKRPLIREGVGNRSE